ncbi:MAG: helix-turn-helix domain-containing protein [Planctomycetota bacterium]|jgi:hypothetical protein
MRLDANEIDALVDALAERLADVLERREEASARVNGRLAYSEAEAAALLGVERHVLRDCRRRGEITARLVGKGYRYAHDELVAFLRRKAD